jgi:hypothetical protein
MTQSTATSGAHAWANIEGSLESGVRSLEQYLLNPATAPAHQQVQLNPGLYQTVWGLYQTLLGMTSAGQPRFIWFATFNTLRGHMLADQGLNDLARRPAAKGPIADALKYISESY